MNTHIHKQMNKQICNFRGVTRIFKQHVLLKPYFYSTFIKCLEPVLHKITKLSL
jgi:hypothetical protein